MGPKIIKKAETIEAKHQCIQFYQKIWPDDLDKQIDIEYFLASDIFYIELDSQIIACIELFLKDKNNIFYKDRYDFNAIKNILEENFVYLSRLATHKNFRNKGYASKLMIYVINKYKNQGMKNIYTTLEDYNFPFYEKFHFIQDTIQIQLKNYTCYNFIKKL